VFDIRIAENAGFCMGVKNAFDKALEIAQKYPHTVILGDIVHNRFAVEKIAENGLDVVENVQDIIDNGNIKNVIIRAHGITLQTYELLENAGKKVFDLTCPIVKKVQLLTKQLSKDGHDIIIFGKKDHPEVLGICGYCCTNFVIVSNAEEANCLDRMLKSPVLISQTTMNKERFEEIQNILSLKYLDLIIHNTLCKNPQRTQDSALELAEQVDMVLVIGDKKSSNTHSLYERIRSKVSTLFIEDCDEITSIDKTVKSIGLTAGCSTPIFQIDAVVKKLKELQI
jgi:4-hydroxy-3-methylbut-2-enyl diphosphate reductase